MSAARNALGTYTAIRFTTGKKAPGVVTPLAKATGFGLLAMMLAPFAVLEWLLKLKVTRKQDRSQPVAERDIPRTASGLPRRSSDMQDLLDQMMEED